MSLAQRVYSVLLVSAADAFNAALTEMLSPATYDPVRIVPSVSAAERAVAERGYDFVLVNSPLPDESGARFANDTCMSKNTVVLLLTRGEVFAEIYDRVAENGVFVLAKPIAKSSMEQALQWMVSARERLRRMEQKSLSIEEKMEEIRLVNRAKWKLIAERGMSEPDAHRYLEKQAMDRGVSRRVIAAAIVDGE